MVKGADSLDDWWPDGECSQTRPENGFNEYRPYVMLRCTLGDSLHLYENIFPKKLKRESLAELMFLSAFLISSSCPETTSPR